MNRAQRRKAAKHGVTPEPAVYYVCDPGKNEFCKKTNCYLNGGPCKATKNLSFAKQPVETCRLILPMSREEAESLAIEQ